MVCNFVGSVRAPLLATVYRHEARDRWVQHGGKPRGRGEAGRMRDADAVVAACHEPEAAARFDQALGARLGTCGREGAPEQTRVMPGPHQHTRGRTRVDVLGGEWRWGADRAGTPPLTRRTARQTRRHARQRCPAWCRDTCRSRVRAVCRALHGTRRGDDRDEGVHGTAPSRHQCFPQARRRRCTGLKRRRPRRRDTGTGGAERLSHVRVEPPRLVGRPKPRLVAWEASAGVRQRVGLKSPVREHCPPGSVRGRSGHWPSYRDGVRK